MDIWTSKQRVEVIGFTAQYEKDWRIVNATLGIQKFSEKHSGVNIQNKMQSFLFDHLGLRKEQVN